MSASTLRRKWVMTFIGWSVSLNPVFPDLLDDAHQL